MLKVVGRMVDNWLGGKQYDIGKYYQRRGDLREARRAFKRAEQWYRNHHGPQHPFVVAALIKQGACSTSLGDIEQACRAYREALAIIQETGGADHPKAKEIANYLEEADCRTDHS